MTRSKMPFRPRSSVLALEPRVLFDGAGAVAAADSFDHGNDTAAPPPATETQAPAEPAAPQLEPVAENAPTGVLAPVAAVEASGAAAPGDVGDPVVSSADATQSTGEAPGDAGPDQTLENSPAEVLLPMTQLDEADAVAPMDSTDPAASANSSDDATTTPVDEAQSVADTQPDEALESPKAGALLIIDARVADQQTLLADLPSNTTVRVIESNESGINAVGQELAKGGVFDTIHIVSHGTPGSLTLGNDTINNESINSHSAALQSWANYLTDDADILLYGCDIAEGATGQTLINQLAHLTGADIAASDDATGAADKGGDWDLESKTGNIEATALAVAGYSELLANSQPTVAISGLPTGEVLIGTDFTFNLTFKNTGSAVGYGPYIDLVLPQGADGDDGINVSATNAITYLGTALTYTIITLDGTGTQEHPYAYGIDGEKLKVTGTTGDKLVVIELPFGSYTVGQPATEIKVTASLSENADVGAAGSPQTLALSAKGGFSYGDTAVLDWATDPTVQGAAVTADVTTGVVTYSYDFGGPEGETTTGPNFPRTFTTTVTAAPGQSLTDYDVIVDLPDNVVFVSVTGGTTQGALPSTSGPTSGTSLTQRFATLADGANTVTVTYYVAETSAAPGDVLDPDTGAQTTSAFNVSTEGEWDPLDVRDANQTLTSDPAGIELTHADKSLALQKTVSQTSTGPGQTLDYTLNFQISDYFSFSDLKIDDVISDGQLFDAGSATLTIYHQGVEIISSSPIAPSTTSVTGDDVSLGFDIAAALTAASLNSTLAGGRFNGATTGGTYGVITYKTTVQNTFISPEGVGGDAQVNQGDKLISNATISGTVVKVGGDDGAVVEDTTYTSVPAESGELTLMVDQVNGGAVPAGGIKPGDTVTYKLTYDLASGDYEKLNLDAYLPKPVFNASNVATFDSSNDSSAPASGAWKILNTGLIDQTPTLTVDPLSNRLNFDFGTRADNTNAAGQKIEILFTVTVGSNPFADGLYLTAQAQSSENNTVQEATVIQSIDKIVLNEPHLEIKHGIVSKTQDGTISGTTGTWVEPGSTVKPFTGVLSSIDGIDGNITNIDAGDKVTFAAGIINTGGSGAFDITTGEIVAPDGFQLIKSDGTPTTDLSEANLKLYLGTATGTALVAGTDYTITGGVITLIDTGGNAKLAAGRVGSTDVTDGSNILVITYDAVAIDTIAAGLKTESTVAVDSYASTDGGVAGGYDFLPDPTVGPALVIKDTATATVAAPTVVIKFQDGAISADDSSADHTTGANLVIGESMIYDIVVTLPEGTTHDLRIDGLVPPGMKLDTSYQSGVGYELITTAAGSGALAENFGGTVAIDSMAPISGTLGNSGVDPRFTVSNSILIADDGNDVKDNSFVIRVKLIADNATGNQAGTNLDTRTQLTYDPGNLGVDASTPQSSAVRVTVVEPTLTITKSVDTNNDGTYSDDGTGEPRLDDNDDVKYKIVIANGNTGSDYAAYDLTLRDQFPSGILKDYTAVTATKYLAGGGTEPVSLAFEIVGGVLQTTSSANLDLDKGERIEITFGATTTTAVAAVPSFDSSAVVQWTSLNGAETNERTGADPAASDLNNYRASDGAPVFIQSNNVLSRVGGLEDTAMPADSTDPATQAIGEIVRFRMVTTVPEGTIGDLNLRALLPPGYSYLGDATVALIADGAMTASTGSLTSVGDGNTASFGTIDSTLNAGNYGVRADGSFSTVGITGVDTANTVRFDLGSLTNPDNDADAEYVVIEFNAIVKNNLANQSGATLSTSFNVFNDNTKLGDSSNTVVDTVAEASITGFSKSIVSLPDQDGNVTVENRFTVNSGTNTTPAYDVTVVDSLPSGIAGTYVFESVTVGGVTYSSIAAASAAGITVTLTGPSGAATGIQVVFDEIDNAASTDVVIKYKADADVTVAATPSNGTVTWSSLPDGGTAFTSFAGSAIGTDGTSTGERNSDGSSLLDSGSVNDYRLQDPAGLGIIKGTLWDDTDKDNVIDGGEGRLAGVTVTLNWAGPDGDLSTTADNQTVTTKTNANGEYSFGALPTGDYRVTVENNPTQPDATDPDDPFIYKPRWDVDGASVVGTIDVSVTDGGTSANQDVAFEQRVNEAPVINDLDATPTFNEGQNTVGDRNVIGTPIALDTTVTITDPELTGTPTEDNFGGTTLTIARSDGATGFSSKTDDVFSIAGTATLTGTQVSVGGSPVATLTSNANGQMVITFLSTATSAQVNAVASAITYANGSQKPDPSVVIRYRFNDDNQSQGQGKGGSLTGDAVVAVTITPINDLPLAVDDTHQINRTGTSVNGNTLTGQGGPNSTADSDPDGDALTVTGVRTGTETGTGTPGSVGGDLVGTYGSLKLNADGTYTYTLDKSNPAVRDLLTGQTLKEYFTYTISDGQAGDDAQLTITIKGQTPNDVPVAVDDRTTTEYNTPVSGSLAGNDTPSGDGGNVWTGATPPSNGTVVVNPDGSYRYTPNPGFSGTDSFTYTITDANGDTSTATMTITVAAGVADPRPGVSPPLPPVPEVRLQPLDSLQTNQVRDESLYFDGGVFNGVARLPIPMHPVVYVTPGVNDAQAAREATDTRYFSDPSVAHRGEVQSGSIGAGLGMDPVVYVQHAVRDSQARSIWLDEVVNGRLGRISLGSDGMIRTPEWFEPLPENIVPEMPGEKADAPDASKAPGEAKKDEAEKPAAAPVRPAAIDRPAGQGGVYGSAQRPAAAPSFSDQLRSSASRAPAAS